MENILQGIPQVCVYINDILITGRMEEEHIQRLDAVLSRLENAGLRLKEGKCAFMLSSVEYLGHRISEEGTYPAAEKIRAIAEAPVPRDVQQLQSFLGLVNYYAKFPCNLSNVLAPLYALLQKGRSWSWGQAEQEAFSNAKAALTSSPVLTHFNPDAELHLECDASPYGMGAVLMHKFEDGTFKPVAYASRLLSATEKKYSQLDKEALAIVFGVKKYHQFLFSRKFVIHSDHKPLQHLLSEKKPIPILAPARIQCWALTFGAYDYSIVYRPGTTLKNADLLSRLPLSEAPRTVPVPGELVLLMETLQFSPISAAEIARWTTQDPVLGKVHELVRSGWISQEEEEFQAYNRIKDELSVQDGCVLWGLRIVVPERAQQQVLEELHVCHPGMTRMKAIAQSIVWWPGIDQDIESKVRGCIDCQQNQKNPPGAKMHPWEWPTRPWMCIHVDYAGPFMGKMFLVVSDAHSKWLEIEMVAAATSRATIMQLRRMFAIYGLPELLVSDNGSVFVRRSWKIF